MRTDRKTRRSWQLLLAVLLKRQTKVDISSQAKVGNDAGSKREIRAVVY